MYGCLLSWAADSFLEIPLFPFYSVQALGQLKSNSPIHHLTLSYAFVNRLPFPIYF